jgi:hypothetical protein
LKNSKNGLILQKVFETRCRGFSKKNRPRRGNDLDVMRILKEEFDSKSMSSTIKCSTLFSECNK